MVTAGCAPPPSGASGGFDWAQQDRVEGYAGHRQPASGASRGRDLDRSAYLVCAPGENYEGFFGFRKMFMAMPLLFPLGALMWVPGVHLIGVSTYRLVADNRHRISRCWVTRLAC